MKNNISAMLNNSFFYRLLAGSWLLGWLVSTPEDTALYYKTSLVYRAGRRLAEGAAKLFYMIGTPVRKYEKTSLVAINPLGFLGMVMFFYLSFDISLNDYSWKRTLAEVVLILLALLMTAARSYPGLWKGTIAYRMINWWAGCD